MNGSDTPARSASSSWRSPRSRRRNRTVSAKVSDVLIASAHLSRTFVRDRVIICRSGGQMQRRPHVRAVFTRPYRSAARRPDPHVRADRGPLCQYSSAPAFVVDTDARFILCPLIYVPYDLTVQPVPGQGYRQRSTSMAWASFAWRDSPSRSWVVASPDALAPSRGSYRDVPGPAGSGRRPAGRPVGDRGAGVPQGPGVGW